MTSIDVRQVNNQTVAAEVQKSTSGNTVSDASIYKEGYSSEVGDTLNTSNIQTDSELQAKEAQLKNALKSVAQGTDLKEEDVLTAITKIEGYTKDDLLKLEQNELNKLIKVLSDTVAAMKEDGIEINAESFEKAARGYWIQVKCGWDSVASFRKANKKNSESVVERLNRFFGCDFRKLSTEEKAEKLDAYFSRYFDEEIEKKLKNAKTPEEVEAIKQSVRTKQLTDFSKLLYNTSPEDRAILRDAIEFLAAKNRYKGYDAVLRSFDTDAERTELANSTTPEQRKRMCTNEDKFGDRPDEDEQTDIVRIDDTYKDAEHIKEAHDYQQKEASEFYTEENIKKLNEIKQKIANGEELTEEEQEIYDMDAYYRSSGAGEILGTGANKVISKEEKDEILRTINKDAYELPTYSDVIKKVNEYIEKHPETLNMPKEDFIALMDKVTNNNYTRIITNSSEPLAAPVDYVPPKSNGTTASSVTNTGSAATFEIHSQGIGFSNTQNVDTQHLEILTQNLEQAEMPVYNTSDIKTCAETREGFQKYRKYHTAIDFVTAVYKELTNPTAWQSAMAEMTFKSQNSNTQADMLVRIGMAGQDLINSAKAMCLCKVDGKFANSALNTQIENEEEKRSRYNPALKEFFDQNV